MRTLIVHRDGLTAKLLHFILTEADHTVILLKHVDQDLDAVLEQEPEAVLLAVELPVGVELCQELRRQRYTGPLIVVTPRHPIADTLRAFAVGADDVIVEPVDPAELVARVEAINRRCQRLDHQALGTVLKVGEAELVLSDLTFRVADQEPVRLSPTELRLLECLMRNHGITISRERLNERIWGYDYFGDHNRVDVYIRRVRKKIERDPDNPEYIQTVRGVGYRFQTSMGTAKQHRDSRLCGVEASPAGCPAGGLKRVITAEDPLERALTNDQGCLPSFPAVTESVADYRGALNG